MASFNAEYFQTWSGGPCFSLGYLVVVVVFFFFPPSFLSVLSLFLTCFRVATQISKMGLSYLLRISPHFGSGKKLLMTMLVRFLIYVFMAPQSWANNAYQLEMPVHKESYNDATRCESCRIWG